MFVFGFCVLLLLFSVFSVLFFLFLVMFWGIWNDALDFFVFRGMVNTLVMRCFQVCLIWFVISEIMLFFSVFWAVFSATFVVLEIDSFLLISLGYSSLYLDDGFVTNVYFLDIVMIIINTFLLFSSGLCANMVLVSLSCRFYNYVILYMLIAMYFGLLFLGNQLHEFVVLSTTFSVNFFSSSFLFLDGVQPWDSLFLFCMFLLFYVSFICLFYCSFNLRTLVWGETDFDCGNVCFIRLFFVLWSVCLSFCVLCVVFVY